MTAPVEQVKEAAQGAIMSLPDATIYSITREAFYRVYGRIYTPATDRREFERIKHHVKRAMNGAGVGRGGKREGAGRPKGEYTTPQWDGSEEDEWLGQEDDDVSV